LDDYPEQETPQTFSTGFPGMDEFMKVWLGELIVVTGIPGHGKSTWVINLCVNLARQHGWSSCLASFEIPTVPILRHKLRLAYTGSTKDKWTRPYINEVDAWIGEHFIFIDSDPTGEAEEEDMTLDWVLDRAREAVIGKGIKVLVIDPWNEVEHSRPRGESETDYTNRSLRALRRFASRNDVIVIVLAHPTKDVGKDGEVRTPTLYDISGSAGWSNKPDHGVVVDVRDFDKSATDIHLKKVRFNFSGKRGVLSLPYNVSTETYGAEVPF